MTNLADKQNRAVVLVSGGLDSATVLAIAQEMGFAVHALSFDYGQRHAAELQAAGKVVAAAGVQSHRVVNIDLRQLGGSALTDESIDVPTSACGPQAGNETEQQLEHGAEQDIPVTYVPARNTVFLSFALAWAEVLQCRDIFIGVNAVDYSGYPDCRPEFVEAFQQMANLATKIGVEGESLTIHAPLIHLSKADIVKRGTQMGVDYGLTVSCYQADEAGSACGVCDSCHIRRQGFVDAGVADPTAYR